MSNCPTPSAILRDECVSTAETSKVLLAQNQVTLKVPLESGDIDNDVTQRETYQDLLEAGTIQLLDAVVTEVASPEVTTATLGGVDYGVGQSPQVYLIHCKTSDEYRRAMYTLKYYKGKRIAFMNVDDSVKVWNDGSSETDLGFFRIEDIMYAGSRLMNDVGSIPENTIRIVVTGKQSNGAKTFSLDFDIETLEQKELSTNTFVSTVSSGLILTLEDTNALIDGSGDSGDGNVNIVVAGGEENEPYTVVDGVLTMETANAGAGDEVTIEIPDGSNILNEYYYAISESATTTA